MTQKDNIGILEKWWVLRHLNPKVIDQQLKVLNEQRVADGKHELTYLIPYQFVREAEPNKTKGEQYEKEVRENNNLRSALHHYLFVKATDDDVLQLVASDWNRSLAYSLRLCRSKGGEPLWASAKDMDRLIDMMIRYREQFNLTADEYEFHEGDTVKVKMDMFDGYEFVVAQFRGNGKGANLTLELPLFNGKFRLRTKSLYLQEEYLPVQIKELLSPAFVERMEAGLVEVVRHRYGRHKAAKAAGQPRTKADRQKEYDSDNTNLNNFHYLNYMELDDSPEHRHIRVLLLLCAALRKDRRIVDALVPVITSQLTDPTAASTDEEALMMAVLYIATQNAEWRTAAKQYEQTHTVLSKPLSLLMPLVKNIHFRNKAVRISKRLEAKQSKQVAKTLAQISACQPESLTPQSVCAIWDILALPHYQTDEGRAVRTTFGEQFNASLHDRLAQANTEEKALWLAAANHLAGADVTKQTEATLKSLMQSRHRLLKLIRPSADVLTSYYHSLVHLYPDRTTPDAVDLYTEAHKLILHAYSKAPLLSTPWWQLKAVLEHYHHTRLPFLSVL